MSKICLLLVLAATIGCATVSDEISLKKFTPQQRLYIGRLRVNFNGDEKPKCEVYINYDVAPSMKLSHDGWILYKTDRQGLRLREIACFHQGTKYLSAWHHQKLPLEEIGRPADKQNVRYFGDLVVDWKIDPNMTIEAAQKVTQAQSPFREGQVKESGELKLSVANHMTEAEVQFFTKVPEAREQGLHIEENVVSVKR